MCRVVNYRNVLFIVSTAIPALALAAIITSSVGDTNSFVDSLLPNGGAVPAGGIKSASGSDSGDEPQGEATAEEADQRGGGFFASIPSGKEIDPVAGKGFLLSVLVRIDQLPNTDARQKIVSKFTDTKPLVGWSLALRRYNGIVRPEVFYRGPDGQGGWFPFEQVQIDSTVWYNVSLIVNPGNWMVLFWEPAQPGAENLLGDWQGGDLEAVVQAVSSDRGGKAVSFLGGHDLSTIPTPATEAELLFGAKRAKGIFGGEVAAVLVAWLDGMPGNRSELRDLVSGGPPGIERRLNPQAIGLLVNRQGKDRSRFSRPISILGG